MNPKVNTSNKPNTNECHNNKVIFKQPISCPWSNNLQPCPSTLNKNRHGDLSNAETKVSDTSSTATNPSTEQSHSLHQSSSQFFYFLRLMQLFPETHPATIHTVLSLCKNDFFCAVDKLLYARRCKSVFARTQAARTKRHPFCRGHAYYCYTNDSSRGTKRSWGADNVSQETPMVKEAVVRLSKGEEVVNKEVLDLTTRNEEDKSTTIEASEIHKTLTIPKSSDPDVLIKNCIEISSETET